MAWWRQAGANYLRFSQVAAATVRRAVKADLQAASAAAAEKSVVIKKH